MELTVFLARVGLNTQAPPGTRFTPRRDLEEEPLPGLMKKVLAHAFDPKPEPVKAPRGRPKKEPPPMPLLAVFDEPEMVDEPAPRFRPVPKPRPRIVEAPPEREDIFDEGVAEEGPAPRKPARGGARRRR